MRLPATAPLRVPSHARRRFRQCRDTEDIALRRLVWLPLTVLAVVLMVVGLQRGEWEVVKRYANTLCTACIGLTGAGH